MPAPPSAPSSGPSPPCQIFIGGVQDLQPDGSGASKCSRLVDAALSYDAFSRAQFLVSGALLIHFLHPSSPEAGFGQVTRLASSTQCL